MKLRFLVSIAGPLGAFAPGAETDWSDDADAQRLIAAGFAVRVEPVVESATVPAPEAATLPRPSRKRG